MATTTVSETAGLTESVPLSVAMKRYLSPFRDESALVIARLDVVTPL